MGEALCGLAERAWVLTGWIIFISITAVILILTTRGIYETFVLDVSFSILGTGSKSLRIVLLSDLHAGYCFIPKNRFRSVLLSSGADAFVFTGDMTVFHRDLKKGKAYMAFFASVAKEAGVPFFAVLGNHDLFDELNEALPGLGIIVLQNESIPFEAADRSVWLILGLNDYRIGGPSYSSALEHRIETDLLSANAPGFLADDCPQVILAHNPDTVFLLPETIRPDPKSIGRPASSPAPSPLPKRTPPLFLLSGHFHGGQIWMPFHFEYRVLREEILPKIGIRKGAYQWNGIWGYISRGLGSVIVPIRLFSKPELAVLELRADGPAAEGSSKE
jgi:predicted MPP superfamily phosphohydrolase